MTPKAGKIVFFFVVLFMALHHDFWLWDDKTLIFGFLPSGLAYHALYSLVMGLFWFCVVKFAWPHAIERFVEEDESSEGES